MEEKYGRLTILKRVEPPDYLKDKKSIYLLCKCECGNEKVVRKQSLKKGITTSCGCYRSESISNRMKENKTHGLSGTRFFRIWSQMKTRCENFNNNQYHNYGARGITVCERWQTFQNFADDMHESYIQFEKQHGKNTASIDRINSNGNYESSNCKWATQLEQSRNRSDNISVEVDGVEYATISELAEKYNLNYQTVANRYRTGKRGMDLISQPKQNTGKTSKNPRSIAVEVNGKKYESLTALQKDYPHISLVSISKRYKKGLRDYDLIS